MRTIVAALLAASAAGCAPWGHAWTLYIDPEFSASEQEAILAAADNWSNRTGAQLTPIIGPCSGIHDGEICFKRDTSIRDAPSIPAGVTHVERSGLIRMNGAESWLLMNVIWVDPRPDAFRVAAGHELGHAMGLQHTGPGTLMCGNLSCSADTVTDDDVAQWWSLR